MEISIKTPYLSAVVSSLGGELQSLRDAAGREYLWQGDKQWWGGRSPNLFPYVGRCTNGQYTLDGQTYSLNLHGFVRRMELEGTHLDDSACAFSLTDSPETLAQFPFPFRYEVAFSARENTLTVTYTVENRGEKTMYFGLGAHPGFQVPMAEGERFEDCAITFDAPCVPRRVLFSADGYRTGEMTDYPLQEGCRIPLTHPLFDDEAIVLSGTSGAVRLGSAARGITVDYRQFPLVGFWHPPHTEAPFVCVEPWRTLPAHQGVVEDFASQEDLVSLPGGETWKISYSITLD